MFSERSRDIKRSNTTINTLFCVDSLIEVHIVGYVD